MNEYVDFKMQVDKGMEKIVDFVNEKVKGEKLHSYCKGKDMVEQFETWCEGLLIKGKNIEINSDSYMEYDNVYAINDFVKDLAVVVPEAVFSGYIEKTNDDFSTPELKIVFKMENGKFEVKESDIEFDITDMEGLDDYFDELIDEFFGSLYEEDVEDVKQKLNALHEYAGSFTKESLAQLLDEFDGDIDDDIISELEEFIDSWENDENE